MCSDYCVTLSLKSEATRCQVLIEQQEQQEKSVIASLYQVEKYIGRNPSSEKQES